MSIEAMKKAVEALEYIDNNYTSLPKIGNEAITALRQAICEQLGLPDADMTELDEDGVPFNHYIEAKLKEKNT